MKNSAKNRISPRGRLTSLTVQPEVPTNMDSHTFPSPEEQLNHHSEPDDPQENPAKRQGPGEYRRVTTDWFNSMTRQREIYRRDKSSYIMCESRTPEEALQDNNDLTIAMNELGQARVQHDGLHEEKGGEALTWNEDPDALWDRCAPND